MTGRMSWSSIQVSLDPGRTGAFTERFRVSAQNGGSRWIEAHGQSFFEFGRCTRFTGVMQDVTERIAAERKSREGALRLQLALDAGDVGTWSFDLVTQAVTWDARSYELMDVPLGTPVTFVGDFVGRLHPDDRESALKTIAVATAGTEYADELRVRLADGQDRWISVRGRRAPGEDEFIGTLRDITADKAMEAQRRLLAEELRHRMKNLLAMVQSIAAQTLRTAPSREDASRIFSERLVALAGTVDALTERTWSTTSMHKLVEGALLPHIDGGGRIQREGPAVQLAPKQALALTLALHELATNAAKYGALSSPTGQVKLIWAVDGEGEGGRLRIEWREEGGPPVEAPTRRSFGSRLIEANAAQELGGSAKISFEPGGVVWRAEAPLAARRRPERQSPQIFRNSSRVRGSSRMTPRGSWWTSDEPGVFTPRRVMQECSASITTPTPWGFSTSWMALADLGGHLLLDLQAAREAVHHPRQLGDAHHPVGRQIAHVRPADHRQHVVLAEARPTRMSFSTTSWS